MSKVQHFFLGKNLFSGTIQNVAFFHIYFKKIYLCANQINKKESSNFHDYEKSLSEMMQKICCEYMEKQLNEGSVSKDKRKKR